MVARMTLPERIGIIGVGAIGRAIAGHVARAGFELWIAGRQGPAALEGYARGLGPRVAAVTVKEAASSDMVVLAVPWAALPAAAAEVPSWQGRVVVDPSNALVLPDFRAADLGGRLSSAIVAELVPGARLVKAFNTLDAATLAADPRRGTGRRVLFLSGDDAAAKAMVASVIEATGFFPVDLGTLERGAPLQQFPGGPLATLDLLRLDP